MKTGYDQFFKKAKETSKVKNTLGSRKFQKTNYKKKSKFPMMQLFAFALTSILGFFVFENSDKIEQQLKRIEIGFMTAQAEEKPHVDETVTAAKVVTQAEVKPDEADYLFKLADRKKQLDIREEELNKYAAEISKQKEEIEAKLKKLEETRQKISTALEDRIKTNDAKVETLVQMYSNMKSQQAAKVFETLDEDLVIEILSRMKKKVAADILNLIKPEKAQILAERYAGYRVPASK
jgi:flagellar motility protein MotE (MotC chaperone)